MNRQTRTDRTNGSPPALHPTPSDHRASTIRAPTVSVTRPVGADVADMRALVADLETWPSWAPVRSAELDPLNWARPTAGATSTPDGA